METPKVKTTVKVNNCTFDIYAYKKLSKSEVQFALRHWMRSKRRKTLPKNGHYKIISIIGFDHE